MIVLVIMVASTSSFFLAVMMLSLWGKVVVVDCLLSIGLNLCVFSYNAEYRNAVVTITWINLFHLQPIHFFSTVWRGKKKCAVWRMLEDLLDSAIIQSSISIQSSFPFKYQPQPFEDHSGIFCNFFIWMHACKKKKKKQNLPTYSTLLCVCFVGNVS